MIDFVEMHHYSHIRLDIAKKYKNSSCHHDWAKWTAVWDAINPESAVVDYFGQKCALIHEKPNLFNIDLK
jgi:hypothetical protein